MTCQEKMKFCQNVTEMSGNFTFHSCKSLDVWSWCTFLLAPKLSGKLEFMSRKRQGILFCPMCRNPGQNKIPWLFPDKISDFPDIIGAKHFINCARKVDQDQTCKLFRLLKCEFLWHFGKISFFPPTDHEIPSLKILKFPWHVWTLNCFIILYCQIQSKKKYMFGLHIWSTGTRTAIVVTPGRSSLYVRLLCPSFMSCQPFFTIDQHLEYGTQESQLPFCSAGLTVQLAACLTAALG